MLRPLLVSTNCILARFPMGKNGDERKLWIHFNHWYACLRHQIQVLGVQTDPKRRILFPKSFSWRQKVKIFFCLSHLGTFLEEETKLERHLPSNINILSLENWTSSEVLMRLQYLGEKQKNLNLDPREILQKKYVKCHVTDMVGMRKIRDNCFNIIFQPLEIVTLILSWNDWMTNSKYLFCEDCISYQKLSSRIRIPTHFILVKV